ncbi:MAG: hypothetical protein ACLTM6_12080 [Eggerthella lenta]
MEMPKWINKQEEKALACFAKGDKAGFEAVLSDAGFDSIPVWKKDYKSTHSLDQRLLSACCRKRDIELLDYALSKGAKISRCKPKDASIYSLFGTVLVNAKKEDRAQVRAFLRALFEAGYKIPARMEANVYRILYSLVGDDLEFYRDLESYGLKYECEEASQIEKLLGQHAFSVLDYFENQGYLDAVRESAFEVWNWWDEEILGFCLAKGWRLDSVSADCERDVLLSALGNGATVTKSQMKEICESLDEEAIAACLEAGASAVFPEFAQEAERDGILELYRRYGFDERDETESLVEGVERGRIPLCSLLEKGAAGACADWKVVTKAVAGRFTFRPYRDDRILRLGHGEMYTPASFFDERIEWVELFAGLLDLFEGDIDFFVRVPMESRDLKSYAPNHPSSHCWADCDVEVYRMLAKRGATIVSGTREAVIMHCAPDVVEFLFEYNGWDWKRLRFGYSDVNECLRHGGNAHAFRWLYEHRRKLVDLERFTPAKCYASGLYDMFIAVLETKDDGSFKTPKAIEYLTAYCKRNDRAAVEVLIAKLSLSPAAIAKAYEAVRGMSEQNAAAAAALEGFREHPKAPRSLASGAGSAVPDEKEKVPEPDERPPIDPDAKKRAEALGACGSVYVRVSGQQSWGAWCQNAGIAYSKIPLDDAKELVKLNSMMCGDYDDPRGWFDGGYAGLSGLDADLERYARMIEDDIRENGRPQTFSREFAVSCGGAVMETDFGKYLLFMAEREPEAYRKYLAYLPGCADDGANGKAMNLDSLSLDDLFFASECLFMEWFYWSSNWDGEGECGVDEAEMISGAEWDERFFDGFDHSRSASELFDPKAYPLACHAQASIDLSEGGNGIFGNDAFVGLVLDRSGW